MEELYLARVSPEYAAQIADYRAEFPADRQRVTLEEERIPGLDRLEEFDSVADWLAFCREMAGKIDWYLSIRKGDGRAVGAVCLRRALEYDDDDPEFASHIGYSVRPSERGKGYAEAQLRLALEKAREAGLDRVRLVCVADNQASRRTILSCGGVLADTLHGEESGLDVDRFDLTL